MLNRDENAGAPIYLCPHMDPGSGPALGAGQINNFRYDFPEDHLTQNR